MSTAKQSITETYSIESPKGLSLDGDAHVEMYRYMKSSRLIDEKLVSLYKQNRIIGGLYSGLGQEATSVGSAYALGEGDYMAPMIRNLGSMIARGITSREVFLQYLARAHGPTRGKDNTLHFGSLHRGIVSPISLLGDMIPIMAGIALTLKMRKLPNVALTYIGDGGSSTGAFHEGMNFASVRKLPLIVILENNLYAYSTPVAKQSKLRDLVDRAKGYGIYGEIVDGNNVLAVFDATRRARERCREGEGPVLIESKTFRRRGHAAHDAAGYVPEELRRSWEARDPLDAYSAFLVRKGIATKKELERIDSELASELETALAEALDSPYPDPESTLKGVYYEPGEDV